MFFVFLTLISLQIVSKEVSFIYDCSFIDMTSNGKGSAICIEGAVIPLSIAKTVFLSCNSYISGGAIYFSTSTNASISLSMICGAFCYCSKTYPSVAGFLERGNFINMILCDNSESSLSFVSITRCSDILRGGVGSVSQVYGCEAINNLNSSYNTAYYGSGIDNWHTISIISRFVTFYSNTCQNYTPLSFIKSNGELFRSNIIENKYTSLGIILFQGKCNFSISQCSFINNEGIQICLYIDSSLGGSPSVSILDSFLWGSGSLYSTPQGSVILVQNNNSNSKSVTYPNQHIKTVLCNAIFPIQSQITTHNNQRLSLSMLLLSYFFC